MQPRDDHLLKIEIPNLWKMTGERARDDRKTVAALTGIEKDSAPPRYIVLLEWDAKLTYLLLKVSSSGSNERFVDNPTAGRKMLLDYGIAPDQLPRCLTRDEFEPPMPFLIAEVGRDSNLILHFRVKTDDEAFLNYAKALKAGGEARRAPLPPPGQPRVERLDPKLVVSAYFNRRPAQAAPTPATAGGYGRVAAAAQAQVPPPPPPGPPRAVPDSLRIIELALTPCGTMTKYEGFVALDLGNTSSTLVCMPREADGDEGIEVIGGADPRDNDTVPSAVRIEEYRPPQAAARPAAPGQDRPPPMPEARGPIGRLALEGNILDGKKGWLVLGSKRLLADPRVQEAHHILLRGRKVAVPKHLPAELFICELMRAFHARKLQHISRMAVTCPTTFSDREVAQLKEVVYFALRRALGLKDYKIDAESLEKVIPLVLDEASAAAFFFLYRDFIKAPGGMRALQTVYPRGVNVLLYDCGGGTTDVALVTARTQVVDDEVRRLEIEVRGRTGQRGFGGDDITAAVFKLLKAKVACSLPAHGRAAGSRPQFPEDGVGLKEFLDNPEYAREFDRWVPTTFHKEDVDQEPELQRMAATMDLWLWAETFKKALNKDEPVSQPFEAGNDAPLIKQMTRANTSLSPEDCIRTLNRIQVVREEVDALIIDTVKDSIDKANQLLSSKLPGQEVHRVYVVGNASRYPLIREMIKKHLRVRFLEDEQGPQLHFDERNLKNAVAKGAVVALRLRERLPGIVIQFDTKLMDRLPYNVFYEDLGQGGPQELYFEHDRYQELEKKQISVPRGINGQRNEGRELSLLRQWPGETKPKPFMDFIFDQRVDGPLELRYDSKMDPPRFLLRDLGASNQEVEGVEKVEAAYCSPAQQGHL